MLAIKGFVFIKGFFDSFNEIIILNVFTWEIEILGKYAFWYNILVILLVQDTNLLIYVSMLA